MNTAQLIDYFSNYLPLKPQETEALISRVKERRIKRRQFILQENDVCQHITFVLSGCFKMYGVDAKGKEAKLFLNNSQYPVLVVKDLKLGDKVSGGIGLWVDVGTEGYFRDLKVIKE